MHRRDISKALIASATGLVLLPRNAQSQTCTPPCYPVTQAEIAAGVSSSINTAYPPGQVGGGTLNVFRFMTAQQIDSVIAENGLVDHTAAIQMANDFLEGRCVPAPGSPCSPGPGKGSPHPGGTLFFPAGVYNIDPTVLPVAYPRTLRVGGNVTWRGDHFQGTTFNFTNATFTGNYITLGPDQSGIWPWTNSYTVGSSLEDIYFSPFANNAAHAIVSAPGAHQFCQLKRLKFYNVNQIGIELGGTGGPAYFKIEDIDMSAGETEGLPAARNGVWVATGSIVTMTDVSIQGGIKDGIVHRFSIGVRVNLGAIAATNLHFENTTDGVYFDNQAGPNPDCSVINGISGSSSCANLIHIPNPCNHTLTAMGILGLTGDPSNPVALRNEVTGERLLNSMIGLYSWSGSTSGFRSGSLGYSALHNTPHVRYGKSATQAIGQNTFTILSFSTMVDDWQSVSEWDGSTYTAKIPGRYRVTVSLLMSPATWTPGSVLRLYILRRGTTQSTLENNSYSGTFPVQLSLTDTVYCGAGDTIQTGVLQSAAASLNTDSSTISCFIAIDRE